MQASHQLSSEERIKLSLTLGESHFREFKSALEGPPSDKKPRSHTEICADIAKTLVAFANADGGELLVGVEDDGTVTGIPHNDDSLHLMINAPRTHVHSKTPLPTWRTTVVEIDNKKVLYLQIPSGTDYCYLTSDGKCLQRRDLESAPVPSEEIKFTRSEINSKRYDREYVPLANITDLDLECINEVATSISKGMSPEKCLQHLELADYHENNLILKKAALLLFSKNIHKWHPRSQIRVMRVDGNELKTGKDYNVRHDEEVTDCIIKLIEKGWELIRPHLTETRVSDDAIFKTQIIYPELACREALINSIAHRDYSIEGSGVDIFVFDNRIEIMNPGGLLSSVSIEDIRKQTGVHQSRNALVAKVLREVGYMRELGEGIRRIFKLMQDNDLAEPEIESTTTQYKITLFQKHIYSKEEKLWLDNFSHLTLTKPQKTVIRLGCDGRLFSAKDIWDACGIVDTDEYRKIVESLYTLHILKNTLPGQQSRNIANKRKITHKQVKKFKIILPSTQKVTRIFDENIAYAKVFVGNLPYDFDEQKLYEIFKSFGDIEDIFVPINFINHNKKGYVFIEYSSRDGALKAIEQSTHIEFGGRKLIINWAHPQQRGNDIPIT